MARPESDRLQKIDEKMAQLKAQKAAIMNREKALERKARTRRLIQKGAIAEKYFGGEKDSPEEFESLLRDLLKIESVKEFLKTVTNM